VVYKLTGLITGRGHIYLPSTPPVAHARPLWCYSNDILGYWVTTAGIMHKHATK